MRRSNVAVEAAEACVSDPGTIARQDSPAFDVDGMLGRLAKWLRILGFDTAFPLSAPSEWRFFVTTRKGAHSPGVIRVFGGTIEEQLREVFDRAGIDPDPDRVFSRCLVCNAVVEEVPRDSIEGKVPAHVFSTKSTFHRCPQCGRVYWEGSHEAKVRKRLEGMGIFVAGESGL
jgi:uncharacterized protein with PIN domain